MGLGLEDDSLGKMLAAQTYEIEFKCPELK